MDFENELYKIINEQISASFNQTNQATSTITSEPFTRDRLNECIDEMLKHKVEFTPNQFIKENECIILDNEKVREDFPSIKQRGKTIFYNPVNEGALRNNFPPHYFRENAE